MTGRQNEYFIPGDGISREVIQADICRYLGNDALVRPGNHGVRRLFSLSLFSPPSSPFTDHPPTGPPGLLHPCLSESHLGKWLCAMRTRHVDGTTKSDQGPPLGI